MNKSSIYFLLVFIFLAFFLLKGLYNDPKKIESPLIGKEFPGFELDDLYLNTTHSNDSADDAGSHSISDRTRNKDDKNTMKTYVFFGCAQ